MLNIDDLRRAFIVYFDEMDQCENAGTFWALLHIVVCLPDICGALESKDGKANQSTYKDWCRDHLDDAMLRPGERYDMRCKVLHQGRAKRDPKADSRYDSFAFGQPATDGTVDHMRSHRRKLHLDVGCMARETVRAVEHWIDELAGAPTGSKAINVAKHLPSIVRVVEVSRPSQTSPGAFVPILKTN